MQFQGLGAFARFVQTMKVGELLADTAGRAAVAELFKREAKARIGDAEKLQPGLAESTQTQRERAGFPANEPLLLTGELRESIDWEHESPRVTIIGSTDPKAVWHEFGTPHVPARSFLGATAAEKNIEALELYSSVIGRWLGKGEATLHVWTERVD